MRAHPEYAEMLATHTPYDVIMKIREKHFPQSTKPVSWTLQGHDVRIEFASSVSEAHWQKGGQPGKVAWQAAKDQLQLTDDELEFLRKMWEASGMPASQLQEAAAAVTLPDL